MVKHLQLLQKWWMVLIQGIILVLFSVFIFKNTEQVLVTLSFWLGILVLAGGLIGIIAWKSDTKTKKDYLTLAISIIAFAFGLWMVFNAATILKIITVFFGLWCLVSGIMLIKLGWGLKGTNPVGLALVIIGVLSVVGAVFIVFNVSVGAAVIGFYLGLQVLFTGISLILLAIAKKMTGGI